MSDCPTSSRDRLVAHQPQHDTLVCIDSDGCVFDSMELKQRQCFHGEIIGHWHLEAIEPYVRQIAEFVNLYSLGRGRNRFLSLYDVMLLLRARPEVIASGITVPELRSLKRFIDSGAALGNQSLAEAASGTGDPELASILEWSKAVNRRVAEAGSDAPMFPGVVAGLELIREHADCMVVSQTPNEALEREWRQQKIDGYVFAIAGQELGTKAEQIALTVPDLYRPDRVLMIGDAPGDLNAARANGVLFFPVNPAGEDGSWSRFVNEAFGKFLAGEYAGAYEDQLVNEFLALLPETPPWSDQCLP